MKTSTTVINGATVATTATDAAGHTQVDLNTLTVNDAILHLKIVNGAGLPGAGKEIEVYYAFSPNDQTASLSTTHQILANAAKRIILKVDNVASATRETLTDTIQLKARYVVMWYKCRGLDNAVTLTTALQT